jgi:signal transduction histidine kinase
LLLRVYDNGIGIARGRRHAPSAIGLRGMAERAAGIGATIRILGRTGGGTLVSIRRRRVFD